MTENHNRPKPAVPVYACPRCGRPIFSHGSVADAGGYKKWVEPWHCPIHGQVSHPPDDPDDGSPEN